MPLIVQAYRTVPLIVVAYRIIPYIAHLYGMRPLILEEFGINSGSVLAYVVITLQAYVIFPLRDQLCRITLHCSGLE